MNSRIRIVLAFCLLVFFAFVIWKPEITGNVALEEKKEVIVVLKAYSSHNNKITGNVAKDDDIDELKTATSVAQEQVLNDVNSPSFVKKLFKGSNAEISEKKKLEVVPAMVVEATEEGIERLKRHPLVEAVYPNLELDLMLNESVPLIGADAVWNLSANGSAIRGKNISVCVIDTGISLHPAFQKRIVDQKCFCYNNCCPNGKSTDTVATDTHSLSHGTHVSGIVAANAKYKGVALAADIVAVKVCSNSCSLSDIISGMDYCLQVKEEYNVVAISGSIGDGGNYKTQQECPVFLDSAINTAYDAGIVSVFASGNNGYKTGISYPACSLNAIAVGATDKNDVIASFTNRGELLDILAPGVGITSTKAGGTYGALSGTSQATPHISGVIALMFQVAQSLNIPLSPSLVRERLIETGVLINGWKRVNAFAAVSSLFPVNSPPIVFVLSPVNNSVVQNPVVFKANASDAEDGILPDESLSWNSDIDGFLGAGSIERNLSFGNHTITLSAIDSGNLSSDAVIFLTVKLPNSAPVVSIENPADNSLVQNPVVFKANASDAEDGILPDESLSWNSDIDGFLGIGYVLNYNLSLGRHIITLFAVDSSNASSNLSINLTVGTDYPPVSSISAPLDNAVLENPVRLYGSGNDIEDGILPENALSWTSSIDGFLGAGSVLERNLSFGNHTITLSVIDSSNLTATANIVLVVTAPNSPPDVLILSPINNSVVFNPVNISASALDAEDGLLVGSWSENNSVIASNNSLLRVFSSGNHLLAFSAFDSKGLEAGDSVSFTARTCLASLDYNNNGLSIGDFVVLLEHFSSENLSCSASSGCVVEFDTNSNGIVDIGDFIPLLTTFSNGIVRDVYGNAC